MSRDPLVPVKTPVESLDLQLSTTGADTPTLRLACRASGAPTAERRVLLLHGFPEAAFVWDGVLAALAPDARCLAPNQRGYGGSDAPTAVDAYHARHLVADVLGLLGHLGATAEKPLDLLVAHDWGGAVAWSVAALKPELIRRLVIINSPHPAAFRRELLNSQEQREASDYMRYLVRDDAAQLLAANDFAKLFSMLERSGRSGWLTPQRRNAYRAIWREGLDGALNWYRASPLRPPADADDDALERLQLPDNRVRVSVPTTVLWGDADTALRPGLLQGLEQWVPDLQVHHHEAADHWIVHEEPGWVIEHLRRALREG